MSKVSVVIPTHNNATFIEESFKSVVSQSYYKYINEIFIIDDGGEGGCGGGSCWWQWQSNGVIVAVAVALVVTLAMVVVVVTDLELWYCGAVGGAASGGGAG